MKDYWRLVYRMLKFGMPLYLLLIPCLALYGVLVPSPASSALRKAEPGQAPVLVGFSYRSHYSAGSGQSSNESHSFILFPAVFHDPKLITLRQVNSGPFQRQESSFGLILALLWAVLSAVGTWWFWFRKSPGQPPNNSSKPTPLRGAA